MRTRFPLLLLLALCCATACRYAPNRHAGRVTPKARITLSHTVAQSEGGCGIGPTASAPLVLGSHAKTIAGAYSAVLHNFIRPLDSATLLNAAWKGAMDEAAKEGDADPAVSPPQLSDSSADADWQTFASAYDALSHATDGQVDQLQMAFAAVSQMAKSVNEGHTYFLGPEEYSQMLKEQTLPGAIGVFLNGKEAPFIIEDVVPGAPADQAGLHPGDAILAVDGCDVSSWDPHQLASHVRGSAGTSVHLSMERVNRGKFDVDITRGPVTYPDLDSRLLPQGIGYIHLRQFPDPNNILVGGKALGPALDGLLGSFKAAGARGWVLDLRGNGGGSVDGLEVVGGHLLPAGSMFSFNDRAGHKTNGRTIGNRVTDPPLLAVLVDDHSASAAEILASAVQDEAVAPIVGSTTAGIANGATWVGIGDGAGLSITVLQTYTRNGRPIDGSGVTPDMTVERSANDLAAGVDPPLDRAVQLAPLGRAASGP